jgi:hypothetical protein
LVTGFPAGIQRAAAGAEDLWLPIGQLATEHGVSPWLNRPSMLVI